MEKIRLKCTFHERQKILCFSFPGDHRSFPVLFAQEQETLAEEDAPIGSHRAKGEDKKGEQGKEEGEKTQRGRALKGARTVASRH